MAGMGRPKGENNKEYTYTFRMDKKTYNRLIAYCKKMNMAKADALRYAIELLSETNKNMEEGE